MDYDLYSEGLRRGLTYPCYRRRTPYLLQVQERLDKLIATLPTKLLSGESSTPFSKDYVWAKTKLLGKGASGSVYRFVTKFLPHSDEKVKADVFSNKYAGSVGAGRPERTATSMP